MDITVAALAYLPVTQSSLSLASSGLVLGLDHHDSSLGLAQLDAVLLQVGLGRLWRYAPFDTDDDLGPLE